MSNYKVGDLASLMPPSNKTGSKLQALFTEHWKKSPNAGKKGKNINLQLNNAAPSDESNNIKKTKKKKIKDDSTTTNSPLNDQMKEIKTDLNSDFLPLPNEKNQSSDKNLNFKRKQSKRFFENPAAVDENQNGGNSENHFKRSAKNKRQKTTELDLMSIQPVNVKENLFSEFDDNTSSYPSKKQKIKKKSKSSKDLNTTEQDAASSNQPGVPESKVDAEKIRLENIKDLPRTLFVGNLPVSVNRKALQKLFSSFGQIKNVRLRGAVSTKLSIPKKVAEIKGEYHKGLQSHTGFVVFKEEESAKSALSLNGTLLDNHHIVVDLANQAGEKKLYNNDSSIFLGNLPFDVDDETVRSAFEECGEIQAVRIVRDKNSGLGKGFGYVQFQKIKSKNKALTLDDVEINGRKIRIKPIDSNPGKKAGPKKTVMMIRNSMAAKKRAKESGSKKSVKKLLKKGKRVNQKKQVARLLGEKFVK